MNGKIECGVIDYLVDRKFKRVGDAPFPSFEEWRERRKTQRATLDRFFEPEEDEAAYRLELEHMSLPALNERLGKVAEQEAAEQRQRAEFEDRTRFFNEPKAQADFDHWSKMPRWTLDEAVALSFRKAPEFVNWDKVKVYLGQSSFADGYGKRRSLLLRAQEAGDLKDPILPVEFIRWAARTGIVLPHELIGAAAVREKPLSTRERETLLKIILGMAIKGYSYNPTKGRSGTPQEIANDLDGLGIGVSVDTVRNKLDEAFNDIGLPPEALETLKR
jgi:hypothetical protein